MAGTSDYPAALDVFDLTLPTYHDDVDSEGRTHKGNHEDLAAGLAAVQTELGTDPAGASATVKARLDAADAALVTSLAGKSATVGLWLPGASGNYVSCPDAAALDITGDIDIRVKVAMDDWTPTSTQMFVAKEDEGSQRSYWLALQTDGTLAFYWSSTGAYLDTYAISTVATGITDGAVKWVRATLDVNNGAAGRDIKFWLSDDGVSWTQLGSTVTQAGTTSVFASTTALTVGSWSSGSGFNAAGKFYRATVKSGIGGTSVADLDLTTGSGPRIRDAYGNLWTINGTANGWQA
jgi:hypothetical protein